MENFYPSGVDYYLVEDDRAQIRFNYDLLYTNKLIHGEFSALIYAHHDFDLSATSAERTVDFLHTIRPENVMHVKHLSVHFPKFLDAGEEYELENDSLHMFASIENHATNLKTLTLCPARKDFVKLLREDRSIVAEKLSMLQKYLQAIPSLEKKFCRGLLALSTATSPETN